MGRKTNGGNQIWMNPCPALFLGQKSSLHRIESGVQAAFGFVDGRICSNIFDMKKQPAH
jgi:hypothetical protein